MVTIAGVTDGGTPSGFYNGTFVIDVTSSTTFTYRIPCVNVDPAGSPTCSKVVFLLDKWMRELPARSAVFLGPGVFETRGNHSGWLDAQGNRFDATVPQEGWNICGSGVDVTVLKVVVAEIPIRHDNYGAIGKWFFNQVSDGLGVRDLTVDCNMQAHPYGKPYSWIAKTAVNINGSHTRFRRLRVKDFGTQTIDAECFPITSAGVHSGLPVPVNCVIEECIMELPSPNSSRETTCISMTGTRIPPFYQACVIRDCVLDGRYAGGMTSLRIPVKSVAVVEPGICEIETGIGSTFLPHGRALGGNVAVSKIQYGISGEYADSKILNGSFAIHDIVSATKLQYRFSGTPESTDLSAGFAYIGVPFQGLSVNGGPGSVIERNRVYHMWRGSNHDTWTAKDTIFACNYFLDVEIGPFQNMGSFGEKSKIDSVTRDDATKKIATLVSHDPHGLIPGQAVHVLDVKVNGSILNPFNGYFEVLTVTGPTLLTYAMKEASEYNADVNTGDWQEFFRVLNYAVERNIVEVAPSIRYDQPATAIRVQAKNVEEPTLRVFRRLVFRENIIRHLNDIPNNSDAGIVAIMCEKGVIQNNIIDVQSIDHRPLVEENVGRISYLNNQRSSGAAVSAWNTQTSRNIDELRNRIEDATLMSL
jgi:hypothetical protein